MVEGARLESVYTSKGYRGFESLSLRKQDSLCVAWAFFIIGESEPKALTLSTRFQRSLRFSGSQVDREDYSPDTGNVQWA